MSNRINIVKEFYEALDKGDHRTVSELYHKDAHYRDEIFDFKGLEIHALWYSATRPEMNLSVELVSINEEEDRIVTEWIMSYTLDIIKRSIKLREKGTFRFDGDKIIEHTDEYDFWLWCSQAFGLIGKAFGWSNWLQKRVRNQARKSVLAQLYSAHSRINQN